MMASTASALLKAEALARFLAHSGAKPTDDDQVTITRAEAYELLDHLEAGKMGRYANHDALVADIKAARAAGDPWQLLESWRLMGFKLVPLESLN